MSRRKTDTFLLPELLIKISKYIDDKELFNCLLVDKTWYNYFLPILWRNITISSDSITLLPQYLESHRQYVFSLQLIDVNPHDYPFHFPNLKELEISGLSRIHVDIDQDGPPLKILELNTSIVNLEVRGSALNLNLADWNHILAYQSLTKLSTVHAIKDRSCLQVFWRICERLSILHFMGLPSHAMSTLDSVTFFPIRELHMSLSRFLSLGDYIKLLSKCPELESLVSPIVPRTLLHSEYNGWPNLCNLTVTEHADDMDLSVAIKNMRQVTSLQCTGTSFGTLTFLALQKHFNTLVTLRIDQGIVERSYTQEILSSAPNLQTYKGAAVKAMEMAHSKPWVSLLLSELSVHIRFESNEDHLQPLVFKQLSRLTRLRILEIGTISNVNEIFLKFNLDHGMDQLSSLKMLEIILARDTRQNITNKDAEWMEKHLVSLELFRGSNYAPNEALSTRFRFFVD